MRAYLVVVRGTWVALDSRSHAAVCSDPTWVGCGRLAEAAGYRLNMTKGE